MLFRVRVAVVARAATTVLMFSPFRVDLKSQKALATYRTPSRLSSDPVSRRRGGAPNG